MNKKFSLRRPYGLAAVTTSLLVAGGMLSASPASAAGAVVPATPDRSASAATADLVGSATLRMSLTVDRRLGKLTSGPATMQTISRDKSGKLVASTVKLKSMKAADAVAAADSGFECVTSGKNAGFRAWGVRHLGLDNSEWFAHYLFHTYSIDNARRVEGQGYTFQVEECFTGGARNKSKHRLAVAVAGAAAKDNRTVMIGNKYGVERRDGSVSSSLNFKVEAHGIGVGADIPMSSGGSWGGSNGPDSLLGAVSNNSFNQVNARWDFTYPGYGTAKFKGNVGHGLWEWRQSERAAHPIDIGARMRRRY